jgi:hypothetical protein
MHVHPPSKIRRSAAQRSAAQRSAAQRSSRTHAMTDHDDDAGKSEGRHIRNLGF